MRITPNTITLAVLEILTINLEYLSSSCKCSQAEAPIGYPLRLMNFRWADGDCSIEAVDIELLVVCKY